MSKSIVDLAPMPTILVIPTGIGCEIGGYAGDAIPSARLLASASGCLITHPNVMNGGSLFWSDKRIQYVEGYGLDRFATGELLLRPVREQKIGLLLDAGLNTEIRERHLQVVDGCRASLGLNIGPIVTTDSPLQINLIRTETGTSSGEIGNPNTLLKAGEKLKEQGATAIAAVTSFPENHVPEDLNAYRQGNGVDTIAGAEALISHLLVKQLVIPCAHAPGLSVLSIDYSLDPRAAGEELGYTFLTSVLVGLSRAPDLIPASSFTNSMDFGCPNFISVNELGAIVAPEGALGGEAVLACLERGVPLISVENQGVLTVNGDSLGLNSIKTSNENSCFYQAKSFAEAAGYLLALREGICISAIKRPLQKTVRR